MGLTNDEAMTLAKQGFTADEIRALGWSATAPEEKPEEKSKETNDDQKSKAAKSENADPEPDTKDNVSETLKTLTDTVNSLTETVKAMQENNQKTARKSKNENAPKSADEVIKGFIENM